MSRRGSRPPNSSLYVRNIPDNCRQEDIREVFSKYGDIKDVYIPLDHYTREPRGFCYIHTFDFKSDAEDAMYAMDHTVFFGRELDIQFAEGDRKTPTQMRGRDGYPPRRWRSRSRSRNRNRRSYSRSPNRRSRSRSPYRSSRSQRRSPRRSPNRSRRSHSRTKSRSRSVDRHRRRRRHGSYSRSRSISQSRSRSRSR